MGRHALLIGAVWGLLLWAPGPVVAEWYDNFDDGWYERIERPLAYHD